MRNTYAGYTKPIVLLAFADPEQNLPNLIREFEQITSTLEKAKSRGLCDYIILPFATTKAIIRELERPENRNRIAVFHYAGHANSELLILISEDGQKEAADAKGLADILRQQTTLRLIFLNACSTAEQVERLRKNLPQTNIIATLKDIPDAAAVAFSTHLYDRLERGDSIRQAYDSALRFTKTSCAGVLRRAFPEKSDSLVLEDGPDNQLLLNGEPLWKLFPSKLSEQPVAEQQIGITMTEQWPSKQIMAELKNESETDSGRLMQSQPEQIITTLEHWRLTEAVKDPLYGLPPVFVFPKPPAPFRGLASFKALDAGIFAGREHELRKLYDRLNDKDAAQIILLSGQAGVGKSSLLEAGLLPRLASEDSLLAVLLCSRAPEAGLLGTLGALLKTDANTSIAQAWRQLERQTDKQAIKPLVVILDKVDEVFTNPCSGLSAAEELRECCAELAKTFALVGSGEERLKGKLLLGVRKERLAEITKHLREQHLGYEVLALDPLDYWRIVKAISVAESYYDLELDQGILSNIADDLLSDSDSSIAPVLQIILAQMWEEVRNEPPERRVFTRQLYWQAKDKALKKFFDEQLAKLKNEHKEEVETGLALDLLVSHMTPDGALWPRDAAEIEQDYGDRKGVLPGLIQACKDLYLLTDYYPPWGGAVRTRLIHKSLSPIIWNEYSRSVRPGQRARRVIEYRVGQNKEQQTLLPLNQPDLTIVENGRQGMRAWKPEEQALISASNEAIAQTQRRRFYRRLSLITLAVLLLIGLPSAFWWNERAEEQKLKKQEATLREEARKNTAVLRNSTLMRLISPFVRKPSGADPDKSYEESIITRLTSSGEADEAVEELRDKSKRLDKEKEFDNLEPAIRDIASIQLGDSVEAAIARLTRKRPSSVAQSAPPRPAPSPTPSRPLVYMHIQLEEQRGPARDLCNFLKNLDFQVPGIENVGLVKLSSNQVRYFRESDKDAANRAVTALGERGIIAVPILIIGYENSTLIKPQQLEVWLVKEAFAKQEEKPLIRQSAK
jgi:hypothetical protein